MKSTPRFKYGMRLRGCAPGCQPSGFIERLDDESGKYWDIIVYDHKLSDREVGDYDLEPIPMTIREMREALHLTQVAFAHMYGIPVRNIQNWEAGLNSPPEWARALLERAVLEDM